MLASGDFNGDDYLDLAIGVPGDSGTAARCGTGDDHLRHEQRPRTQKSRNPGTILLLARTLLRPSDRFGAALAAGDFNGDGRDDLAIGVPGQNFLGAVPYAGVVNVAYGTSVGFDWDSKWSAVVQSLGIAEFPEEPTSSVLCWQPEI